MAASLEHRRLAIAAALRAVMAEPLPADVAPPVIETVAFDADPRPEPRQHPSLREALVAEIDWDEPEHAGADDLDPDFDRSPDDLSSLGEYDDDWVAPSVPPLELEGSMSRVASMALFGHA